MARELSPTLEAQQKWGLISWPYVIARITKKWGGVIRYDFDSLYSGEEDDYLHCSAMPSDGSLIRLRVTDPGLALYYQRVTNPDPESDFTSWTDLSIANVIAVASCSYEANVSQFYINTSKEIYHRESADSGANWGAWAQIGTADDDDIRGMDATYKASTDIGLFFIIYADVYVLKRVSGAWGNIYIWNQNRPVWTTPTSHTDPGGVWNNPTFAYDDDTTSWANATVAMGAWSNNLELNHAALQIGKIRFWTVKTIQTECEVDVFYDGDWHNVFAGEDYKNGNWTEAFVFGSPTVTKARYRGKCGTVLPDRAVLYEFDFGYGELRTNELSGLSVYYDDGWYLIITGKDDSQQETVWAWEYKGNEISDLAQFEDPLTILQRGSTEPYTYAAPCVRRPDTTRLYFVENFTQEENLHHIWYSHMPPSADFADNAWLEPVPTEPQSEYGLAFTQSGSYAWLTNANRVFRALATEDELVLSARLLEIDSRDYPDIFKGSLKIAIDNTGGWYNAFDRLGQQLEVGIGYRTPAGNEYSLVPYRWITKFKLVAPPWYPLRMIFPTGVIGTLLIETEDAWTFLYRYRTRRTLSWAAGEKSVKELIQFFIARSGLDFEVISQSDAVQNFKPEFSVRTGTSYRTAIKNLLKMVPDQLVFREAKVLLRNPTTAEAVDWTYHTSIGTALLVFRGSYGHTAWDPNRAEVWGDTFMKMAANWPQVTMVRDRLSRVTTPTYPNVTRAGERADAELRRAEILTGEESEMTAPINCGLEPWDVLQITDLNAGVTAVRRRVLRIKSYWNARHWAYSQTITLGAD